MEQAPLSRFLVVVKLGLRTMLRIHWQTGRQDGLSSMLPSGNADKMDIVILIHRDLCLDDSLEAGETPLRYIFMLVR
jgi:hypothetical protein